MWQSRNSHYYNGNYSKQRNRLLYMQQQWQDLHRLQLNDPSFTTMRCGIPNDFDINNFLVSLGQALEKNTHLRHLTLLNLNLNLVEAQALSKGIGGSKLEFLSLSHSIQANFVRELDELIGEMSVSPATSSDAEGSMLIWQCLWEGLQSSQTIKELSIGILPTDGIMKLGEALPLMQSLRKLGFEKLRLTETAARSLASGMSQSTLESLELKGCIKEKPVISLDTEEQPTKSGGIRQIFCQGIISSETISNMVLVDFPVEELDSLKEGLQVIKTLKVEGLQYGEDTILSSLVFFNSLFQESLLSCESCMTALALALHGTECLTSLVLQKCKINAASVNILFAHCLSSIVSFIELKLDECNLCDDEIGALVENWHPESSIRSLSLQNNIIRPDGVQALLHAASDRPNLRTLDLSNNISIGYEGLRIIGDELPNQEYLTYLDLSKCVRYDDNFQQFFERTQDARSRDISGLALLEGIKHNSHILQLNVGGNHLSKDVENNIHFYANANMGRHLMAADPQVVALSVWSYILAKSARQEQVKLGASVIYFYLLEQPTLVQHISYSSE